MTFEPHPIRVLNGGNHPPLITILEQKIELIQRMDLDVLIITPFTREFAALSPRSFVEDILIRKIGVSAIVVGKDYTFGRNREGTVGMLKTFAELFDFELVLADWIGANRAPEGRISSTRIRDLVLDGQVYEVHPLLGRYYQVRGTVATGATGAEDYWDARRPTSIYRTNCALRRAFMPLQPNAAPNRSTVSPTSATARPSTITSLRLKFTSWTSIATYTAAGYG